MQDIHQRYMTDACDLGITWRMTTARVMALLVALLMTSTSPDATLKAAFGECVQFEGLL